MELDKAYKLARELMDLHGLHDWDLMLDYAVSRFGLCNYNQKRISLSKTLVELNSEEEVKDTILHEIAHALTPKAGHKQEWKDKAKSIGCSGERCYSNSSVIVPKGKYKTVCPNCKKERVCFRKPKRGLACGSCCRELNNGRYDKRYMLQILKNGD
jgi:predicted SprT family Zn-dependent metalloprotease